MGADLARQALGAYWNDGPARRGRDPSNIPNVTETGAESNPRRASIVAWLALLCLRGVLLWMVILLAVLAWLAVSVRLQRRGVKLGQFLGWADLKLMAFLEWTILRPLFRSPIQWTPVRVMPEVAHRVGALDLASDAESCRQRDRDCWLAGFWPYEAARQRQTIPEI